MKCKKCNYDFNYGESQVGKTTCLEEHLRRNNHGQTKYIRVPATTNQQQPSVTDDELNSIL